MMTPSAEPLVIDVRVSWQTSDAAWWGERRIACALLDRLHEQGIQAREGAGIELAPVCIIAAEIFHGMVMNEARLVVHFACARPLRSLRSWFQWQHVQFVRAQAPFPALPSPMEIARA